MTKIVLNSEKEPSETYTVNSGDVHLILDFGEPVLAMYTDEGTFVLISGNNSGSIRYIDDVEYDVNTLVSSLELRIT